jgi:dTDP-4-amino-4,6-dideoxygalactose transaminase
MTHNPIPVYVPSLPTYKKLEKYLAKIDASHHYSNFGPLETEVRERFSEYLGLPLTNIVTCANATLGLEGTLETNQSSDLWHLPSWTFSATASAVLRTKSKGRFKDVDDDWRVLINTESKNLIDVLPFGQAVGPNERYQSPALKNLVIDAAASFDSLRDINMPKNIAACGVISFHATKVMPAGEGGLFFTNSSEWAEKFRAWTTFGMSGTRISEIGGSNAKMSEYHAAVLLASLDSWDSDRSMWLEQKERAKELTINFGLQSEPNNSSTFATPYWIVSSNDALKIQKIKSVFAANDIQTREWWEDGCHAMPAYRNFEIDNLTKTDFIAKHSLGLPFWKDMSDKVWNRIEQTLQEIS